MNVEKNEMVNRNKRGATVLLVMIAIMVMLGVTLLVLSTRADHAEETKQAEIEQRVNDHLSTAYAGKWLYDEELEGKDEAYIKSRLEELMGKYQSRTVNIRINKSKRYLYTMEDLKATIQYVCMESGEETLYPAGREEALAKHIVSVDKDLPIEEQDDIIQGKRQTKQVHIEIRCQSNKDIVTEIVKGYSDKYDKAPKNATIKSDLTVTKEKNGRVLDTAKIAKDMNEYLSSDDLSDFSRSYQTSPVKATITAEYLEPIHTIISSTSTVFIPTNVRGGNIKIAASRIDGRVLQPEESMSFLEALYDDSDGKSYGKAGGFLNNKVVQVEGGGICQVSTTAYDAFLLAGIIPTERHPHTCMVSYVKPGFDAALAVGTKDLVVMNTLDVPLMIRCYVKGSRLYVAIYSYEDAKKGYTYKIRSESEKGSMTAQTFLDVYQGDQLVDMKFLAEDTYKKLR